MHRHNVGYLVCTLYGYQNIVQLALHRFKSAALLEDSSVTAPEGFDLDDYIDTGEFSYPLAPRPVTLELAFEPAAGYHLYETPLAEDQQIKEKDGMLRVTAKIRPSQELLWWILGFGDMVEVIRPASLRRTLKGILEDAAGLYKD